MSCTLHQPVAGLNVGDTYSGPLEAWLVVSGYASDGSKTDKVNLTAVLPAEDPSLAENREEPGLPFAVKGKETKESKGAVEVGEQDVKPLPPLRNRIVGRPEDDAVAKETAKRDGSVKPEDVKDAEPKAQVKAEKAAEAEPVGNVLEQEPTDEVQPPPAAEEPPATKSKK